MKSYKITKKQVIKALETEPILKAGHFFKDDSKTCAVCAVGAVLRQCRVTPLLSDGNAYDFFASSSDVGYRPYLEDGQNDAFDLSESAPLTGLSVLFETLKKQKMSNTYIRTELINFVCATFPEVLTLDV